MVLWFKWECLPRGWVFEHLRAVCGGLEGPSFLEDICHWRWILRFPSILPFPVWALPPSRSFSLSTPLSVLCFYSQFELSASSPCYHTFFVLLRSPDTRGLLSPWNLKPKQTLRSVSCLGHDISPQQQKKVTNTDGLGSVGHLCGFHSRVPIKIAFIHAKYDWGWLQFPKLLRPREMESCWKTTTWLTSRLETPVTHTQVPFCVYEKVS